MQNLLTADVTGALFALFPAACSLAILFLYSWRLALLVCGSALLLVCVTAFLSSRQLHRLRTLHRINGRLSALAYALLSGIAKLRVSGAERQAFDMWAEHFSEQRRHAVAVQQHSNLQFVIAGASGVVTSIGLFAIVGLASNRAIGVGEYMAFSAALAQFQAAALTAIGVIPTLLGFVPVYERMQPILQTVPESHTGQRNLTCFRGEVELCHVSFRYRDGPPVLEDISIAVAPGEFVALVGPSGSGKSTCLRLMLGFERPETGAVLIDGHDIRTLSMRLIRREMGVVMQNGKPLVGDIFHNIIGSLPLNLNDAWRAARFVGLEEEIRNMPMGMFTVINARGVTFSGGQRQRLLLARAVVRSPRVLLLDEATSALDNRMQQLVGRNLAALGATRIAVAHRLSTVRHADRIYVLEHGRVVEHGTFDELIARGGLFARMAERQVL